MNKVLILCLALVAVLFVSHATADADVHDVDASIHKRAVSSGTCRFCEHKDFGGWCFEATAPFQEATLGWKLFGNDWKNVDNRISSIECATDTYLEIYDAGGFNTANSVSILKQCKPRTLYIANLRDYTIGTNSGASLGTGFWNDRISGFKLRAVVWAGYGNGGDCQEGQGN